MSAIRSRTATLALLAAAAGLLGAGCASSDAAGPATSTAPETSAAPAPGTVSDRPVIGVTAVDFAFNGLPRRMKANTRLALTNEAASELHELVAIRLPDDEQRPVDELLHLPEAELGALLGAAPPAAVLLAAPGRDPIPAVGDGTLTQPGRYLLLCAIPTGVSPDAYLAAAAASAPNKPDVPGGPPHFAHGMAAELIVE